MVFDGEGTFRMCDILAESMTLFPILFSPNFSLFLIVFFAERIRTTIQNSDWVTNNQTNKQTNTHTHKKKLTKRQTNKQTHTHTQTNKQTYTHKLTKQTNKKTVLLNVTRYYSGTKYF